MGAWALRPASLRLATLAFTLRVGKGVSDVVITFVNYVVIHSTAPPYLFATGQGSSRIRISLK